MDLNPKRQVVFLFLMGGLALVLALSGCGPRGRVANSPAGGGAVDGMARSFKLKVLAGSTQDPRFPERSESGLYEKEQDRVVTDSKISFLKPIALLDLKRPVYFVWDELSFGPPIRLSRYEVWKETPTGQILGTPQAHFAERDRENNRWFIPLSAVFGTRLEDIDPAVTYKMLLDLVLSDGRQISIQIYFSGLGVLPAFGPKPLERILSHDSTFGEIVQHVKKNGEVLGRERYDNPTARPLTYWVRFSDAQGLRFRTYPTILRYPDWVYDHSQIVPSFFYYESLASLTLTEVRLEYPDGRVISKSMAENSWVAIEVAPYSGVVASWVARLSPRTQHCNVPPPEHQIVRVVDDRDFPDRRGGRGFVPPRGEKREFDMPWSLFTFRIDGQWTHEARVSDSPQANPDLIQNENWPRVQIVLPQQNRGVLLGQGILVGTHLGPFGCQGVF